MAGPFTLRIVRPFASREDYLKADAWTVERSEMLLVGVEGVSQGASVNFEIVLENREVVVRGEGRALELVPPRDGRPGGVRIRFRQLDPESKSTLRKALEAQKRLASEQQAAAEAAKVQPPPEAAAPTMNLTPLGQVLEVAPAQQEQERPSGVHHRLAGPVSAPENREALLERLRERARLRKGPEAPPIKSTAAAE